uniref:NADH dehydrogenase subunit 6 n=1 Tax=Dentathalia scutellariae TaxID=1170499 RepID=UPI0021FD8EF7|nr:NADH dehydrogenase subunit 6 [Dentathalia scutellariae]UXW93344.1 NADH dehydrogenase subunit 6 [Dentathalia scutellariae]
MYFFYMTKFLLTMMMINTLMFYFSKTPLTMLMFLIIQTLLISLESGMMSMSFWYSYILFVILMGGTLILFIYINSLIPNQKLLINKNILLMIIMTFMVIYLTKLNLESINTLETNHFMNNELDPILKMKLLMNKLYNKPTHLIMFMLINYLLLMLFITVKIININMGPIRKNN